MKKTLAILALTGATLLSGCKALIPVSESETRTAGTAARLSYTPNYYTPSGNQSRNVPVDKQDSSFLYGSTEVKAGSGLEFTSFKAGMEGFAGNEDVRFILGADIDFSLNSLTEGGQGMNNGMYDIRKQSSDTRSDNSSSYVYDKISSGPIGATPFVGLEFSTDIGDLRGEFGMPYKTWVEEWGNHRFNTESKVGSQSEGGFGKRFSLGLYPNSSRNSARVGVEISTEQYETDLGKISGTSAAMTFKF